MKTETVVENGFKETEIGLIPEDWETTTLENEKLFEFTNGLWKGKKVPFVTAKVIRNTNFNNDGTLSLDDVAELDVEEKQFTKRQLSGGDIILERSGGGPKQPVGRVVFFDLKEVNYSFSNFTTRIRVKDINKIQPKYILYYLLHFYNRGYTYELQQRTTGIRNLNFKDYKKIQVPLLSLTEQQKIVYVLSKIQQAIEQQDRIIEITRELKKSLMNKLFIEGLHGEEQKETEIGLMPKSWQVRTVKNTCEKPQYGYTESASDKPIGPKFLRITDITDKGVDWLKVPYCKCPQELINKYKLEKGDILFARIGATTGKSFIVEKCPFAVYASYLIRLRTKTELNPMYLYYFFNSEMYWKQIDAHKGSSLKKGVNGSILASLIFPFPKKQEQEEIANILLSIDKKIYQAESKKQTLQALFRTMLNQLMTGKVRVKDFDFEVN